MLIKDYRIKLYNYSNFLILWHMNGKQLSSGVVECKLTYVTIHFGDIGHLGHILTHGAIAILLTNPGIELKTIVNCQCTPLGVELARNVNGGPEKYSHPT